MGVYVILYNIRSAHNVGSIFRTADGAGVSKVYLVGYTPAPVDRFGRENKEIQKTALGATASVPYEHVESIGKLVGLLQTKGISIVAVEQTEDAIPYKEFVPKGDVAFIFGNEITGVGEDALSHTDAQVQIPMRGKKESLNVSVCAGIILFHFQP